MGMIRRLIEGASLRRLSARPRRARRFRTQSGFGGRFGADVRAIAAIALVLLLSVGAAPAAERVALVIGNANYANPQLELSNPINDARGLSEKLRELEFDVIVETDADRDRMLDAIDRFRVAATDADMAVFFYAGHGVQIGGENHLIGTGFSELALEEVGRAGIALGAAIEAYAEARPEIGIIILDACRDNPFAAMGEVPDGLARASGGPGLLLAYATDPGNVAYDGRTENSVFTEALLNHIETPGLDARLMFGRVRQQVILSTDGQQVPWVEESVVGEHSFNPVSAPVGLDAEIARDVRRWREVSGEPGREPYEAYLAEFPNGLFRDFAEARLERRAEPAAEPPASFEQAIVGDELPQVVASLEVLGFMPGSAADSVSPETVTRGVAVYAGQLADPAEANPDRLFMDAARTLVLLGANTAQQLRTDLVALEAIEKTLTVARDAYRELAAVAGTGSAVQPILQQAEADLEAIRERRAEVLTQLDASREYYDQLLQKGRLHFSNEMPRIVSSVAEPSRQLGGAGERLFVDARRFVKHVEQSRTRGVEGSYAWLADFLP